MATRKIKDAKDLSTNELIYFKGHAKATYMSDGKTVEEAINQIGSGGSGGITAETDPIFSASPAASITEAKKTEWDNKQDSISDLKAIRSGAALGATALQSVPSGYATTSDLDGKVDKISGKALSTEDFTTALKTKLEGLSNYDDTELSNALSTLRGDFDKLVSGDTTTAINTFNEVIAFLDGIQDTQDLSSIIASIEQQIAAKQDKITDLDTIRSGAAKGATALQSYTEKYTGTITGITMNGASKGTSGVVDLGTVITAHQDISGKADKSSLSAVATSGSYNDLSNKPTIPAAVTESTVSGWGFTKNTGTYSKPSTGIPKTDLATAVQTSLDKADTALQSYTEQYKGTVTGVKVNGSTKSPSSGTVDLGNVVTSIKINGSTKTPSNGVVDLGTIEGGNSSSGGSSSGTSDINSVLLDATQSSFTLQPNTYGVLFANSGMSYSFNFNLPSIEELRSGKIVEYNLRIAIGQYGSGLGTYTLPLIIFPSDVIWHDTPTFDRGVYDISFIPVASKAVKSVVNLLGTCVDFDASSAGGNPSTDEPA